jgi:hypothetical protein
MNSTELAREVTALAGTDGEFRDAPLLALFLLEILFAWSIGVPIRDVAIKYHISAIPVSKNLALYLVEAEHV